MVKEGDTIKDVITYVGCRIDHLQLEREKIPYTVPKQKIQKAINKLTAKIDELHHVRRILHENIKEHSKYEYRKVQHLKKMKDMVNKERGMTANRNI
jgi:hypothetical protein